QNFNMPPIIARERSAARNVPGDVLGEYLQRALNIATAESLVGAYDQCCIVLSFCHVYSLSFVERRRIGGPASSEIRMRRCDQAPLEGRYPCFFRLEYLVEFSARCDVELAVSARQMTLDCLDR